MSVPATALTPAIDRDYTLEHKYTRTEGRIYSPASRRSSASR